VLSFDPAEIEVDTGTSCAVCVTTADMITVGSMIWCVEILGHLRVVHRLSGTIERSSWAKLRVLGT